MAEMSLADGVAKLQRRATLVKALLIAGLATTALVLVGEIAELGGAVDMSAVDSSPSAMLYLAISLIDSLLALVTIVFFGMWIYRAAANITAAGVSGFDYTPGWAVGWYFVPFANLVKPFSAMRQIWNASHGGADAQLADGNGLLAIWWGTWIASNISANISFRIAMQATDPEVLQLGLEIGIFGSLIALPLYVAAIKLIDEISSAQARRLNLTSVFA